MKHKVHPADPQEIGAIVQAYARAKWRGEHDPTKSAAIGAQLDPELRNRVDMLGFDAEKLLDLDPGEVLARIEALEREALLEDRRVAPIAASVRAREERKLGDNGKPPDGQWRGQRAPGGKRTQSVRRGGRRHRSQR